MEVGKKDRKLIISYPTIRNVRFSTAKTIADCFKYRNKIGIDVAIEALKDCRSSRKATIDQLWEAAKVCRMANVMRPYLEATS